MNEKLTQIAIEAKVEHCISHVRLQEFAELIVRECAGLCVSNIADEICGGKGFSEKIKQHFGIEE